MSDEFNLNNIEEFHRAIATTIAKCNIIRKTQIEVIARECDDMTREKLLGVNRDLYFWSGVISNTLHYFEEDRLMSLECIKRGRIQGIQKAHNTIENMVNNTVGHLRTSLYNVQRALAELDMETFCIYNYVLESYIGE